LKASDGKVYKTDANYVDERSNRFIGFATENLNAGDYGNIIVSGKITVPAMDLSPAVAGCSTYMDTLPTGGLLNSQALDSTNDAYGFAFMVGDNQKNVSSIDLRLTTVSGVTNSTISIYAVDANGYPTGAVLATSDVKATPTSNVFNTWTFSTPLEVKPGEIYSAVLRCGTNVGATYIQVSLRASSGASFHDYNLVKAGTITGYNGLSYWSTDGGAFSFCGMGFFRIISSEDLFQPGDPLFLGETAGSYSLYRPAAGVNNNIVKIAKILSDTEILIEPRKKTYLGQYINDGLRVAGSIDAVYVVTPPQCEEVVLHFQMTNESLIWQTFETVFYRNIKNTNNYYFYDQYIFTITWVYNTIKIIPVQGYSVQLISYFYT
jgi:hypothetical protein